MITVSCTCVPSAQTANVSFTLVLYLTRRTHQLLALVSATRGSLKVTRLVDSSTYWPRERGGTGGACSPGIRQIEEDADRCSSGHGATLVLHSCADQILSRLGAVCDIFDLLPASYQSSTLREPAHRFVIRPASALLVRRRSGRQEKPGTLSICQKYPKPTLQITSRSSTNELAQKGPPTVLQHHHTMRQELQ